MLVSPNICLSSFNHIEKLDLKTSFTPFCICGLQWTAIPPDGLPLLLEGLTVNGSEYSRRFPGESDTKLSTNPTISSLFT